MSLLKILRIKAHIKRCDIQKPLLLVAALAVLLAVVVLLSSAFWGNTATENSYVSHANVKKINGYSIDRMRAISLPSLKQKIKASEEIPYDTLYDIDTIPEDQNCEEENNNVKLCLPTTPPINWEYKYNLNRSQNLYLHTWYMLDESFKNYSGSDDKDEDVLADAVALAVDWVNSNPVELDNNEEGNFAWYDMAVSNRGYRLAYLVDQAIRSESVDDKDIALLWGSLLDHLEYLEKDANIIFHNNHGLVQSAGQKSIARRFLVVSDDFHGIYNEASKRLSGMLDAQFTSEGVHKEHSPDYHKMIYGILISLEVADLLEARDVEKTELIGDALYWMILPDDRILNFGDSDRKTVGKKRYSSTSSARLGAWVNNDSSQGDQNDGIKAFSDSGLAVVKHRSTGSYLAQQAAFHSRTHKHADNLSFILYDNDQHILIDAGKYAYLGRTEQGSEERKEGFWYSDPKRMYVESTRAHNSVSIDNKDHDRVNTKPYGSAIKEYGVKSGVYYILTGYEEGSVSHHRLLVYSPGQWLVVADILEDSSEHDYRQHLNFDPTIQLSRTSGNNYTSSLKNGKELQVQPLISGLESNLVRGQTTPNLLGWHSPVQNEFKANQNLSYIWAKSKTAVLATLLNIGDVSGMVEPSQANSFSATDDVVRADLSWSTGSESQGVNFELNPSGEIMLNLSID